MKNGLVASAVRVIRAAHKAYARKWHFLVAFAFVFALSFFVLWQLGLTPDPVKTDAAPAPVVGSSTPAVSATAPELPVKIEIPAIDLSVPVSDPTTTDTNVLDGLLLKGAVHYPTSALLGQEDGNVVLFGHSSYLPILGDEAYKTFDGIQKLSAGDTITVYSSDRAYIYAVNSVAKESATTDGIPLSVSGEVLTLSTCDSFATKSDRFVVTADFVESYALSD